MNKRTTQIKGIILIFFTALITSVGQFIWKFASLCQGSTKIFFTLGGFVIFVANGFLMIYAYRFGELSVLQPILSIGFVFSLFLGKFVFCEIQSIYKHCGVLLILVGVFLLARSGKKNTTVTKVDVVDVGDKLKSEENLK